MGRRETEVRSLSSGPSSGLLRRNGPQCVLLPFPLRWAPATSPSLAAQVCLPLCSSRGRCRAEGGSLGPLPNLPLD